MAGFPRDLRDLERRFSTEDACRDYLSEVRWPQGFVCPACGHSKAWPASRGRWVCASCERQVSVTVGTVFQDSRTPLTLWFRAIWWVMSQKNGTSALGLQRILGLGSYRTAWTWLHKLRRAMVLPGRDRLKGVVEVDETMVGGVEPGGGRRHIGKKALVAIAAEVRGRAIGRIRLRRAVDATAACLLPFVQDMVEPGSTVVTDGFLGYTGLSKLGYLHDQKVEGEKRGSEGDVVPHAHLVASLLKRWLLGTHQGAVSREHLDYYLDEFTFRFNRRSSRSRGLLFQRLLEGAVQAAPVTYQQMAKGIRGRPRKVDHQP